VELFIRSHYQVHAIYQIVAELSATHSDVMMKLRRHLKKIVGDNRSSEPQSSSDNKTVGISFIEGEAEVMKSEPIGKGGFGQVHCVKLRNDLRQSFAVKIPKLEAAGTSSSLRIEVGSSREEWTPMSKQTSRLRPKETLARNDLGSTEKMSAEM